MRIGDPRQLNFEVEWSGQGQGLAQGSLTARIGSFDTWSDDNGGGIRWTWIELLEHLARAWPFLRYEQTIPKGLQEDIPWVLRNGGLRDSDYGCSELSREAYIFIRRHNLATGLEGLYLPSLSLLREGRYMWVGSQYKLEQFDLRTTLSTLLSLGDSIAECVGKAADERGTAAIDSWSEKEPDHHASLRIQLGLTENRINALVPVGTNLTTYFEAANETEDESSVAVFARMSAPAPLEVQKWLIEWVRSQQRLNTPRLDEMSRQACAEMPRFNRQAFEQGYELARWARQALNISSNVRADLSEIFAKLNVSNESRELDTDLIDAVGCWDSRHGPAVLVNRNGQHAQSLQGRRATLAHELAHLLIDRSGSLPAAEVFGGYSPAFPEKRAKAFAAEFLLPHSAIDDCIRHASDVRVELDALTTHYDVSRELAGWHIKNSLSFKLLNFRDQAFFTGWTQGADRDDLFNWPA